MSKADFEYFRNLDAELLEHEAQNAEQKKWAEHDAVNDVGCVAIGEIEIISDLL